MAQYIDQLRAAYFVLRGGMIELRAAYFVLRGGMIELLLHPGRNKKRGSTALMMMMMMMMYMILFCCLSAHLQSSRVQTSLDEGCALSLLIPAGVKVYPSWMYLALHAPSYRWSSS
jgi:hypothetical protein